MPVVVVESPAKAKTIGKYLGKDFKVMASFGHIRDLPPRDGSVDPEHQFEMKWEVPRTSTKKINEIAKAVKEDQDLILATDPDREGEAISWHIKEVLSKKRGFKLAAEPKRVVFNSVTENSIKSAMESPRHIDMELVDAYLARRALDYLVGYRLSPVLWRKLPGARSAGRVQSVCVRIIAEREKEIEDFVAKEYWSVIADFRTPRGETFAAQLVELEGKKLKNFEIGGNEDASKAVEAIKTRQFSISKIQTKPINRGAPPPFMTATLQQEASRQLRMPPKVSMLNAQKLYEQGLITYMRTDATFMDFGAIKEVRRVIEQKFGGEYLPSEPRMFKSKAKNAQEAHECIRPTSIQKDRRGVKISDDAQGQLYELIWNRTIASQMENTKYLQTSVNISSDDKKVGLRASGRVTVFDGYQIIYKEGRDAPEKSDADSLDAKTALPKMSENESLDQEQVSPNQHFTKPPPRYSEAALVKKMVELGIGRPSTYSSIVSTIQDRGYVSKINGKLTAEPVGRLLIVFLKTYFARYVEFEFTAELEQELDDIAGGRKLRNDVLDGFWGDFSSAIDSAQELRIGDVLDRLSDIVVPMIMPTQDGQRDVRACPRCKDGRLILRLSKHSAAIGCSNSPKCSYRRGFDGHETKIIGDDPETGMPISLLVGNYGPYLQIGNVGEKKEKPKRAGIPKDMNIDDLDLTTALFLLSLPRTVGRHPDDNEPIEAGIGPYGPYLRHAGKYARLENSNEVKTIGMNHAVERLAQAPKRKQKFASTEPLGEHPKGGVISRGAGRYGPYVKWKKTYASIPKGTDPESVSLESAINLIDTKLKAKKK